MTRDPLWERIERALEAKRFDPVRFERCMQDLLRETYPTLVPVVGGSDAGMDGAIASDAGPLPLICTTDDDVIGNFRRSVANHLCRRGGPARCVLVTSIRLTPQRRDNILDAAAELGVIVHQIHDQADVVGRLYRSPKWRLDLLGIPGDPPALSMLPPRTRATAAELVVGRDADIEWLASTPGDLLLVGQPGSGKTHLHQSLAAQGRALFMVCDNAARVADAVREQGPTVIVVDDAHVRLEWVDLLRRIRHEQGAAFTIHANCWPASEPTVRDRMGIGAGNTRVLEPLTQKQVRELIGRLGIVGPDALLHLLISQSDGKPGLAAALVEACKRGDTDRIWTGEALADSLLHGRQLTRDGTDVAILGAFAIGGNAGLSAVDVAQLLQVPRVELRDRLASLGAGGVVSQLDEDAVAVRPEALRAVLVRDVFFAPPVLLDFREFVGRVRGRGEDAIHVLLSARQRGADVPLDYLEQAVVTARSSRLWEHFAWVDERCARLVLTRHPDWLCAAADGLLHHLHGEAVAALVEADADGRHGAGRPDQPLGAVREWLCPWDDVDCSGERRRHVVLALERLLARGRVTAPALARCVGAVLDPGYHGHRSLPGEPNTFQFRRGVLPLEQLKQIVDLWPRCAKLLATVPGAITSALLEEISDWAWPGRNVVGEQLDDDLYDFMKASATQMLASLLALPTCSPPARLHIAQMARHAGLELRVDVDPVFELFFGERGRDVSWERELEERRAAYERLADDWISDGAAAVAHRIGSIEATAAAFGTQTGGPRHLLYAMLAERCDDPERWLDAFTAPDIPVRYAAEFLDAVARRQPDRLGSRLSLWLDMSGEYRERAVEMILRGVSTDVGLLDRVLSILGEQEEFGEFRFADARIPPDVMRRLLDHPNDDLAAAAAGGEWWCRTQHEPRPELLEAWSRAIVRTRGRRCPWLHEVFAKHPDLAYQWAQQRLTMAEGRLWEVDGLFIAAGKVLDKDQRRTLLLMMDSLDRFDDGCFDGLMGEDVDLYADWYGAQADDYLRQRPLCRRPGEVWERLAVVALSAGVSPEDLAACATRGVMSDGWSGPASHHYRRLLGQYEALCHHEVAAFRLVGLWGTRWARERMEAAERRERHEAVYGHR